MRVGFLHRKGWWRASVGVVLAVARLPVVAESAAAQSDPPPAPSPPDEQEFPVPESGSGRRIVYSNSQQRVWLVEDDGSATRTYLVSGRHRSRERAFTRCFRSRATPVSARFASSTWFASLGPAA